MKLFDLPISSSNALAEPVATSRAGLPLMAAHSAARLNSFVGLLTFCYQGGLVYKIKYVLTVRDQVVIQRVQVKQGEQSSRETCS